MIWIFITILIITILIINTIDVIGTRRIITLQTKSIRHEILFSRFVHTFHITCYSVVVVAIKAPAIIDDPIGAASAIPALAARVHGQATRRGPFISHLFRWEGISHLFRWQGGSQGSPRYGGKKSGQQTNGDGKEDSRLHCSWRAINLYYVCEIISIRVQIMWCWFTIVSPYFTRCWCLIAANDLVQ